MTPICGVSVCLSVCLLNVKTIIEQIETLDRFVRVFDKFTGSQMASLSGSLSYCLISHFNDAKD